MLEITGDLWDFYTRGHWICVTTNGVWNSGGRAVMGRGTARQAADLYPDLPIELGNRLKVTGNHLHVFSKYRIITFPVKVHWSDEADLVLIQRSAEELSRYGVNYAYSVSRSPDLLNSSGGIEGVELSQIYLPRPGCGNGRLTWPAVKPVIAPILDDRFTVVWNGIKGK